MKKILFILFIVLIVYMIYLNNINNDELILSIGTDFNCDYNYEINNTRVDDIQDDIDKNKKIKDRYFQNILIKSKKVIIDLNNIDNINNDYVNLCNLLITLRKYTRNNIVVILNKDNKYSNSEIFNLIDNYDIIIKR